MLRRQQAVRAAVEQPGIGSRNSTTSSPAPPDSIGAHLNGHSGELSPSIPLLVVTGSDFVIFPGNGRAPLRESFRNSMRGFVELTAVSHLGVAVPFLIRSRNSAFPTGKPMPGASSRRPRRPRVQFAVLLARYRRRSRRGAAARRRSPTWSITAAT
jgi:hypothetical protein